MSNHYFHKTLFTLFPLLVILWNPAIIAQNVTLSNQNEVINFGAMNVTAISGDLFIDDLQSSPKITDLSPLLGLHDITGDLRVFTQSLKNLDGLDSLSSIGGHLVLENNDSLQNVDGLAQLFSVPGDFFFRHNKALKNLEGFLSLNSIGGKLVIEDHSELENIDGLFQVPTLGGEAFLKDNPSLKNVDGLASLISINGRFILDRLSALENLEGLSNLTNVSGELVVTNNPMLTNCCDIYSLLCLTPPSCTTDGVGGTISISANGFDCSLSSIITNGPCTPIDPSQPQIKLHSIANARNPFVSPGDGGYTLDGVRMQGSRSKLLSLGNFGPVGVYNKRISIIDGWEQVGSLENIADSVDIDLLYFGMFSPNFFTSAELDSLYNWSVRGGKMIIGASASNPGGDFIVDVLNSHWDFNIFRTFPVSVLGTTAGLNSIVFNGPFGGFSSVNQGGITQGYFTQTPDNILIIADDGNGNPTLYLDCETLDLVVSDGDVFNDLGGITSGTGITSNNDKIWANAVAFMDSVDDPPTIIQTGNVLSTDQVYAQPQWLLDGVMIPGATSNSYTMTQSGTYSVNVLLSCGCTFDVSYEATFSVGTDQFERELPIAVYPNPAQDLITIDGLDQRYGIQEIILKTISGSIISYVDPNTREIDISSLAKGIYLLTVQHGKGRQTLKFVKI